MQNEEIMTVTWIAEQIVKFLGIVLGASIVVWQIGRQFENSLKLQRENKIDELRLELYKEIGNSIENACAALSTAMIKISYSIPDCFKSRQSMIETFKEFGYTINPKPVKIRGEDIINPYNDAQKKTNQVILMMEKYEIVFLDLYNKTHRELFNTSRELADIHMKYFDKMLPYLPVDVPIEKQEELKTTILNKKPPSEETLKEIKALGYIFQQKAIDLLCILFDLRVEAQNMLLSHMFNGKKVPKRTVGSLFSK